MNKREVIREISTRTDIDSETCLKVTESLETVLSDELEKTKGIRNVFDKVYDLLNTVKDRDDQPIYKKNELFDKLANLSGATVEQSVQIVDTLIDILNEKIEVSRSARMKFDIVYKLTNFFKHN